MSSHLPFRTISWFAALSLALMVPVTAKSSSRGKKDQAQLRIVCASNLPQQQQVVLASRDAEGKWQELATVELRSSLITDWLPAKNGELHLASREEGSLKSICQFEYPTDSRHALVALAADPEKNAYDARVIDPKKPEFSAGSVLALNFSPHECLVSFGSKEEKIGAGAQSLVKPDLEGKTMYHMTISYINADGKTVPCFDRQVSGNPDSHNLLFMMPDKTLGVRVLSLPMFGSLE